ncbi:DUF3097 domain-containing protein [Brevibacterium sp. Re57]|uniref:DUF3097 domain-containing protein n=1 Tax=Brevibacterium gallinarum TaxID=2762220 RepID=A0ABR8WTU7_9MICO|nr:DUF3097 domain-containing protein [Brevibacterium gallinarum]MBU8577344.1 DUF3097 family protein [Brevibacterium luteolum]
MVSPNRATPNRRTYPCHVTFYDPYGADVLAGSSPRAHRRPRSAEVPAQRGLVVEDVETGYVGAITGLEKTTAGYVMRLEDRHGRTRLAPLGPGYWVDGRPVTITRPQASRPAAPARTASGSVARSGQLARVARGSRIWVEGKHDAELVEKIWGDDLRGEGVVVEPLGGLDLLADKLAEFGPDRRHRVGVLADHLVTGTKESRIAAAVLADARFAGVVHIIGHPYIDIWQAVKPAAVGIRAWPQVPRGEDFKVGTLRRLGWPARDQRDIALGWQRILRSVTTIADVEPTLSGRVEELIDFVTVDHLYGQV